MLLLWLQVVPMPVETQCRVRMDTLRVANVRMRVTVDGGKAEETRGGGRGRKLTRETPKLGGQLMENWRNYYWGD